MIGETCDVALLLCELVAGLLTCLFVFWSGRFHGNNKVTDVGLSKLKAAAKKTGCKLIL